MKPRVRGEGRVRRKARCRARGRINVFNPRVAIGSVGVNDEDQLRVICANELWQQLLRGRRSIRCDRSTFILTPTEGADVEFPLGEDGDFFEAETPPPINPATATKQIEAVSKNLCARWWERDFIC